MDFFLKNLRETLDAINSLIDNNINVVNCKRIRRCQNVKSSNRSRINFIWRSLDYLEKEGILAPNGILKPKNYKILKKDKINVDDFIQKIDKFRKSNLNNY